VSETGLAYTRLLRVFGLLVERWATSRPSVGPLPRPHVGRWEIVHGAPGLVDDHVDYAGIG
jgi:hypothetical protein